MQYRLKSALQWPTCCIKFFLSKKYSTFMFMLSISIMLTASRTFCSVSAGDRIGQVGPRKAPAWARMSQMPFAGGRPNPVPVLMASNGGPTGNPLGSPPPAGKLGKGSCHAQGLGHTGSQGFTSSDRKAKEAGTPSSEVSGEPGNGGSNPNASRAPSMLGSGSPGGGASNVSTRGATSTSAVIFVALADPLSIVCFSCSARAGRQYRRQSKRLCKPGPGCCEAVLPAVASSFSSSFALYKGFAKKKLSGED
mmetsp:Transcript_37389/g.79328  ORF Transcript_37389/g.79328 Transcript_37389/m.79328 type:complete len:251 (+) Transcript_37389:1906-2658(+)